MKILLPATALALMLAGPALAFHCPKDMTAIDAALPKAMNLTAEQKTMVMDYRAKGEALHKAGDHQASVDTLAKAMAILGIK